MKARTLSLNSAGLLMAFSVLLAAPAAQAAGNNDRPAPAPTAASTRSAFTPSDAVIVKIGTATLEEYRHGDPAERTLIVRDGVAAQNTSVAPSAKHGA